jgi:hypothetical protein
MIAWDSTVTVAGVDMAVTVTVYSTASYYDWRERELEDQAEALRALARRRRFFPETTRGPEHKPKRRPAPHVVPTEYDRAMRARWLR